MQYGYVYVPRWLWAPIPAQTIKAITRPRPIMARPIIGYAPCEMHSIKAA